MKLSQLRCYGFPPKVQAQPTQLIVNDALGISESRRCRSCCRAAKPLKIVKVQEANTWYLASRRLDIARNREIQDIEFPARARCSGELSSGNDRTRSTRRHQQQVRLGDLLVQLLPGPG